jgi:hypothetical protein
VTLPASARPGPLTFELDLEWAAGKAHNRYDSVIDRPVK